MTVYYELIVTQLGGRDASGATFNAQAEIAFMHEGREVFVQPFAGYIHFEKEGEGLRSVISGPSCMTAELKSGSCKFSFRPIE